MNTDQLTTKAEDINMDLDSPLVFHIGWMRTGTTFLQGVFENHANIQLSLKNRFFSYDPYYLLGRDHYKALIQNQSKSCQRKIIVDSDENYAMGRFKTHLREKNPRQKYNYKAELSYIHHDVSEMILRIKEVAPNAKIFGVVRKQANWFESVYKHDVYHFGLDKPFEKFYESELGKAYRKAADYCAVIESFQAAFGKDNVKIMLFEDFVQKQAQFVDDLSEFLGLNIAIDPTQKLKKNASTSSFFTQLHQKANLLGETKPGYPERKFYELLRSVIYRFDHLANKRGWRLPGQVISKSMEQQIYAEYQESNNKLGKLLNKEIELKQYGYFQ